VVKVCLLTKDNELWVIRTSTRSTQRFNLKDLRAASYISYLKSLLKACRVHLKFGNSV
jgi:hypothetical protein